MNDLSKKLGYKSKITVYLKQLSELSNKPVCESDLGTMKEVEAVKQKSLSLSSHERKAFEISLDELSSNRFANFFDRLSKVCTGPVYIWLDSTNTCGTYQIAKVSDFNLSFDPRLVPEGVVVLLTECCEGKLLLDFDEENVQVELQGEVWSEIEY